MRVDGRASRGPPDVARSDGRDWRRGGEETQVAVTELPRTVGPAFSCRSTKLLKLLLLLFSLKLSLGPIVTFLEYVAPYNDVYWVPHLFI